MQGKKKRKKRKSGNKSLVWEEEKEKTWEIQCRLLRNGEKKEPKSSQAHRTRTNKSGKDDGLGEGVRESLGCASHPNTSFASIPACIIGMQAEVKPPVGASTKHPAKHPARAGGVCEDPRAGAGGV